MSVPLVVGGPDGSGVNDRLKARRSWIFRVVDDRPLYTAEAAADVGDHHMADDELSARMRWIDFVARFDIFSVMDCGLHHIKIDSGQM
jgi:hypothetical protein